MRPVSRILSVRIQEHFENVETVSQYREEKIRVISDFLLDMLRDETWTCSA